MMRNNFTYTAEANPHAERARAIMKKYPQVRQWMKPYPLSGLYISLVVLLQFTVAGLLSHYDAPWWGVLIAAYCIGAFANHALFVMIHDACHDVIAKSKWANRLWGIVCNFPQGFPSAMGFRTYHLLHHAHMNEYNYDADLAFHWEAKWIGNSRIKKALWFCLFLLIEAIRPSRLKKGKVMDGWTVLNLVLILGIDVLTWIYLGPTALIYLFVSSFFSVGLHPVGARWIQEHYTYHPGQETFSYYGPLNKLSFNIGFHNEHHDLFKIPWVHLPKLKKLAPEFYEPLHSHNSWSALIWDFIMNPERDLYCRIVRERHHSLFVADEKTGEEREDTFGGRSPALEGGI
jgi:sphingolipid delta-4 desaturase